MTNPFGFFSKVYFQLQVIHMNRQVLILVNNSQLLLKLEILDKFRFAAFHKRQHKEVSTLQLVHTSLGEMRVLITSIHNVLK